MTTLALLPRRKPTPSLRLTRTEASQGLDCLEQICEMDGATDEPDDMHRLRLRQLHLLHESRASTPAR
jgi:hypothetical protein